MSKFLLTSILNRDNWLMVEIILSHEKVLNVVAKKDVFLGGEAHSISGFLLLLPVMHRDFTFQKSWICVHFLNH